MKWLVLDAEDSSYELYSTQEQAEKTAAEWLSQYASIASEHGWPEGERFIKIFKLHSETERTTTLKKENCDLDESGICKNCDYVWHPDFDEIWSFDIRRAGNLKDWAFEEIDSHTAKVSKACKDNHVGVIVKEYKAQHDDRKSTAEHVLFLLAKDIMQNS